MKKEVFYGGLILILLCTFCFPLAAETGDKLFLKGLYAEAIDAYEEELGMTDDPALIYRDLATAYYQVEDIERAMHYFQLAVDADPDDGMSLLFLAILYELTEELDAAEASYLKATDSSEPRFAVNGFLGYAVLLLGREEPYDAIAALEAALARIERETNPDFQEMRTDIYDNIGYIYVAIGENEAALDAFTTATQTGTENPIPWIYLGVFLEDTDMYEEALLAYQEALARDSDNMTLAQAMYDSLLGRVQSS
jgi:tetratricopeptide (TPR) repeat protein